jgi:peroxiredoxin
MSLTVGSKAPQFSIVDSEKQPFTSETIAGKNTLLLFFPYAFTSTCTKELCGVRDDISRYNSLNIDVIGISVDSLFTLRKYKEEQGLNFKLASDFNKEMVADFGTQYVEFIAGMKGAAKRSAFIIDKNGFIKYAEVLENASEIPDFDAIHKAIDSLVD